MACRANEADDLAEVDELIASFSEAPRRRSRLSDSGSLAQLLPQVYEELRQLAGIYLRKERAGHTLQPTALVHEAYLRLLEQRTATWQNRAHLLAISARMMRRILINHADARGTAKRGGGATTLSLDLALEVFDQREVPATRVHAALQELERLDPRQGQIVELRFFGGLNIEETAEVLGISPATVKREWTIAKLWLEREIERRRMTPGALAGSKGCARRRLGKGGHDRARPISRATSAQRHRPPARSEFPPRRSGERLEDCAAEAALDRRRSRSTPRLGRRIGAYRIVRELGRGGMGAVFLGRSARMTNSKKKSRSSSSNAAPIPMKCCAAFAPNGKFSPASIIPNIARLLDAGTTQDGLPYFVMEHVSGARVTRLLFRAKSFRAAIGCELFLKICGAVQFAHQNLVVHRDLKPANILVDRGRRTEAARFRHRQVARHGCRFLSQ